MALSFAFEVCRLYGGFFTSPQQLKSYEGWAFLSYLSYINYAFIGVALNELTDLEFSCTGSSCAYTNGNQIIDAKGYNQYSVQFCAGILVLYIFVARFICYIALRMVKM